MSTRLHRRQFLQCTSALVAAWHAPLPTHATALGSDSSPRLARVKLQCHKMDELRRFYGKTLGLPTSDKDNCYTIKTGPSELEFSPAAPSTEPFYHFAWNIPENQFAEAKKWLSQRTPLLKDSQTGKDEVYFASWNAHAIYFRDPAGNIGEFIARHTLKNSATTRFSEQSLQCLSEIGMVTRDVKTISSDLSKKLDWPKTSGEMSFVGDGMGYLIVAPTGRPWLPDRIQKAIAASVDVCVEAKLMQPIKWEGQPFVVRSAKS